MAPRPRYTPTGRLVWDNETHESLIAGFWSRIRLSEDQWADLLDFMQGLGYRTTVVGIKQHMMKQMKKVAEPSAESPPPPPPGAIPRRGSYNKGKSTTKKDKATPKKSASQPKPRPQKRKSSKQTSKDDANSVDLCDSEAEGEDRTDWDADVPDRAPKRSQSEVSVAQQIAQLTPHRGSAPDNMMAPQPMDYSHHPGGNPFALGYGSAPRVPAGYTYGSSMPARTATRAFGQDMDYSGPATSASHIATIAPMDDYSAPQQTQQPTYHGPALYYSNNLQEDDDVLKKDDNDFGDWAADRS